MAKKVELLAPARNYEAFLGALNAGADAVYLGGAKFSARAYADNFTTEEICKALHVAHFYGKKIYLTVNTLLKNTELEGLYEYLAPFYEAGLDGVIVQDLGVFRYIHRHFKDLALHASTQMALTGVRGASLLGAMGAVRIVPARELSLDEITKMKRETGLEIECFIHGAMCYCYSGQCLFSSVLGGRSGNRGRCAQPCRLPYGVRMDDEAFMPEGYPLSLKDMCMLQSLPKLIAAGIDSFKIEGRMKKPEYAAGVTALYRKYIDLYYEKGVSSYCVEKSDLERVKKLYIRSEIQEGYYERHNGREMIVSGKPGYLGSDEALLRTIRETYIHEPYRMPVKMEAHIAAGQPLQITMTGNDISVTLDGETVQPAKKAPLSREDVQRQLMKTGDSCLAVQKIEIAMEPDCFLPVRALNQLRRDAAAAYENAVIVKRGLIPERRLPPMEYMPVRTAVTVTENLTAGKDCLVSTLEQLSVAVLHSFRRIYVESDLYVSEHSKVDALMHKFPQTEWFLALPYVIRQRDETYCNRLAGLLERKEGLISGFLLRSLESVSYVSSLSGNYRMIPDAGLYCFNTEAVSFWKAYTDEFFLPYELNAGECRKLTTDAAVDGMRASMIVYGTIPMMVTANCLRKTAGQCVLDGQQKEASGQLFLSDRYQASFPVITNCVHCYNVIYNSLRYSLHLKEKELYRIGAHRWRYDFTTETGKQTEAVLSGGNFPFREYTTGHFKRGVE